METVGITAFVEEVETAFLPARCYQPLPHHFNELLNVRRLLAQSNLLPVG